MSRIRKMIEAHDISSGYIENLCRMRPDPERPIRYDPNKDRDGLSDIDNAYFAAVFASLAYKPQLELEKELSLIGYTKTNLLCFRYKLSSGFILEWDDVIIIAFRGSKNLHEWVNNFKTWFVTTPYGRIHAGFYKTIEDVGPSLCRVILPGLLSGAKIVITGHSRGGATATLFGAMLALNDYFVHAIYTFGSPRIGDKKFAEFLGGKPEN